MDSIRLIVIEDEFFVSNHLKKIATDIGFKVVGSYHSGEQFLKSTDWNFDAALVDVFLSDKLTGIDVAKDLKAKDKKFIFITANQDNENIGNATQLMPEAYIAKPFKPIDVEVALKILQAKIPSNIKIKGAFGVEELNPAEIRYIKAEGSYIEICTGLKTIVQRRMLGEISEQLSTDFIRVHRSYLVNRNFVESKNNKFWIVEGTQIPLSRNFKE